MYISMKFGTGAHVFCWQVGESNRSCFCSVSCKSDPDKLFETCVNRQNCVLGQNYLF